MIDAAGYRHFSPPMRLDFSGWSRQDARSYFSWFVDQIPERIDELRRVVEAVGPDCTLNCSPDSLACLGHFLFAHVEIRPSTPAEIAEESDELPAQLREHVQLEKWQLTERTLSLCVDVGIYLAEVLRSSHNGLRWSLWTRKTVDYNRPVLVGFQGGMPFDPARIAINVALGKARDKSQPERLQELFRVWSKKVAG